MSLSIRALAGSYFRQKPWLAVLYVLLSFYYPIRVVLIPYLVGKVTTELGRDNVRDISLPVIKRMAGWIAVGWVVSVAMRAAISLLDSYVGPRYHNHVRRCALGYVMRAYRRNYQEIETGDVLVKLFTLPGTCYKAVKIIRSSLIPLSLAAGCGVVVFALLNRPLLWMYLGFLGALALLFVVVTHVLRDRWVRSMEERDRLHEGIDDILGNIFALYVTDTIGDEQARVDGAAERYRRLYTQASARYSLFHTLSSLLKIAFVAAMLVAIGVMRFRGATVAVAPLIFVILTLDTVLYNASLDYMNFLYEACRIEKTQKFLDRVGARIVPAPPPCRDEIRVTEGRVAFRRTRVDRDGRGEPVLSGVDVAVSAGTRVLVTGPIGSGKSTLMRLLVGLVPYTGSVTLDGHEVRDLSATELKRAVTYVPQSPRLFNRTVLENITHGFPEGAVTRRDVDAILERLQLADYPPLDFVVGKGGSRLSGGQCTIVYLIRAFFRRTPVVVLDEPTASLDPQTKTVVRRVVGELFTDRTLFVITHDLSVAWGENVHLNVAKGRVSRV